MAKIEAWEDAWGPIQELREWAFQECANIEIKEGMGPFDVAIRAGRMSALARVVFKIDLMAEQKGNEGP